MLDHSVIRSRSVGLFGQFLSTSIFKCFVETVTATCLPFLAIFTTRCDYVTHSAVRVWRREPMPVRGYLYMRGLGLMSALASFYLIFTCVVSFFFGVKDSLDSEMDSSAGLRPSWAYIVTVSPSPLSCLLMAFSSHGYCPLYYNNFCCFVCDSLVHRSDWM